MDVRSAELTKYAANAMLATRISFMNELANLADEVGADIEKVRNGIGSDSRIGHSFLYAGVGYGGSCFPKDVLALRSTGQEHGKALQILKAVHDVNNAQKSVLTGKIIARVGEDLFGKKVALWGLAFKPQTDDMRDAPSRVLIADLVARGAVVQAHDPVAIPAARAALHLDLVGKPGNLAQIIFCDSPEAALVGADFLVVITEWKVYRSPDFNTVKAALKEHLIFDGRNIFDPLEMKELDIEYHGIGRRWKHSPLPEN
jgi:UDPglucose 6-dehydrogenase